MARINDLIFDVGLHLGEDTHYYLQRGFKVVAFEANPELVQANREKFAREIEQGDLVIVEGAVVDDPSIKIVKFYVNEDSSVWGTVDPAFAQRNEQLGTSNRVVEVAAVDFRASLQQYGIPYFMKIDIEGADLFCLKALEGFEDKPAYLSMESDKVDFDRLLLEIELIEGLGYSGFKAVQQAGVAKMKIPPDSVEGTIVDYTFSREGSGLFGSDLPGKWLSKDEIIREYRQIFILYRRMGDGTIWQKNPVSRKLLKGLTRLTGSYYPGWYDTHARHRTVRS